MKPVLLSLLLAAAAPAASAGGLDIDLGFGIGHGSRVVVSYHDGDRQWVPGHFETVTQAVCIPGHYELRYIPPVYRAFRDSCGRVRRVLVSPARSYQEYVPAHTEYRATRVYVPGHWVERCHDGRRGGPRVVSPRRDRDDHAWSPRRRHDDRARSPRRRHDNDGYSPRRIRPRRSPTSHRSKFPRD